MAASAAPPRNTAPDPSRDHTSPAAELPTSTASPDTRLNAPKAVPRSAAGARSATIAASRPWLSPMCSPHSVTPTATPANPGASASTRSATTKRPNPAASNPRAPIRSDNTPAGQAEAA